MFERYHAVSLLPRLSSACRTRPPLPAPAAIFLLTALAALPLAARAADEPPYPPREYSFEARITQMFENNDSYLGEIGVGDAVTGTFAFTDEPLPSEGAFRSIHLEVRTPARAFRVDHPPLLYCRWDGDDFKLAWDNNGSVETPWTFSSFNINLEDYFGHDTHNPNGAPSPLALSDFSNATLTLKGYVPDSSGDIHFGFEAELTALTLGIPAIPPGAKLFLDSGFWPQNLNGQVMALARQPDGRLLAATHRNHYRYGGTWLQRVLPNGFLDPTLDLGDDAFVHDPGTTHPQLSAINALHALPDGDILLFGRFTEYAGLRVGGFVRLNGDGSVDPDFEARARALGDAAGVKAWYEEDSEITEVEFLPDGTFLIAGVFSQYDGVHRDQLARIRADGSLVEGWNANWLRLWDRNSAQAAALAHDPVSGKTYVGGYFEYAAADRLWVGLVRLNPDGSHDASAWYGDGFKGVTALDLMPDGRLLLGGDISSYTLATAPADGYPADHDPGHDGPFLPRFDDGSVYGASNIHSVTALPNGTVMVTGSQVFLEPEPEGSAGAVNLFNADGSFVSSALGHPFLLDGMASGILEEGPGTYLVFGEFFSVAAAPDDPGNYYWQPPELIARLLWLDLPEETPETPVFSFGSTHLTTSDAGGAVCIPIVRRDDAVDTDDGGRLEEIFGFNHANQPEYVAAFYETDRLELLAAEYRLWPGAKVFSLPVALLPDTYNFGWNSSPGTKYAQFALQYDGAPIFPNTSTAERTRFDLIVHDTDRSAYEACVELFGTDAYGHLNSYPHDDYDGDGRDNITEIRSMTDARVADAPAQPRLFLRRHPNAPATFVLEFPFNGDVENFFEAYQLTAGPDGLAEAFLTDAVDLSNEAFNLDESVLLYGHPGRPGVIGIDTGIRPDDPAAPAFNAFHVNYRD